MSQFESAYLKHLRENMTSGAVLGADMASVFSGDHYAPEDARVPKLLGAKKKKKKKKDTDIGTIPIARRPFPETIFLTGVK